ncbi:MAG: T9SS C-terminal target domain-containing protein [Balneolaceae bacterium]|nr:MAG: T9SS C-terminal target domain-containing protein [Balneolaceae bacterium]
MSLFQSKGNRNGVSIFSLSVLAAAVTAFHILAAPAMAGPMSGTFTIGPGGDYSSFSAAMEDINDRKVGGDIILEIEPGIYNERLYIPWLQQTNFQTSTSRLTLRSSTGNAGDVILKSSGLVVSMHINARNVTFENFTVETTSIGTPMFEIDGWYHIISDMTFIGGHLSGANYSVSLLIENCTFLRSSISFLGQQLAGVFIIGNTFYNGRIGMNRVGTYAISENVIYSQGTGIQIQDARAPSRIFNNYVYVESGSTREALFLHTVDSVLVYHNTLKSLSPGSAFRVAGEANIHLKNNILFTTTGHVMDLEFLESVTSDFNGFYTSRDVVARSGLWREWELYETYGDFIAATGQDANSIFRDPRFDFEAVDSLARMMPGTTAFERAGMNLLEVVPEDLMGNPRPAAPSLGAIEYLGTETSAPGSDQDGFAVLPVEFALSGNYPNPFNPSTTIRYDLHESTQVTLTVFDVYGRRVATLASGSMEAGTHSAVFDASGLASGVYLYRLSSPAQSLTGKMVLTK